MIEAVIVKANDERFDDTIETSGCDKCGEPFMFRSNKKAGQVACPSCDVVYGYDWQSGTLDILE